jgi:hypothetical protein
MPGKDAEPRRKAALFGVQRAYVDTLEASLAETEQALARAQAENAGLTEDLQSARLALKETAGWSERLPAALEKLASLAAGDLPEEYAEQDLAEAVLELIGEHLLASVAIKRGDPTGEVESETQRNENGKPIRTSVRAGACQVSCTWQPGIQAGPDTAEVVESLCRAVVFSLAGVEGARVERDVVTQLGDSRSLARHLALRRRLAQPAAIVNVTVDGQSVIVYGELYGRLAWSASLADAASVLDRLARLHGGQAYQVGSRCFRVLVDVDRVEQARELVMEALEECEGLVFAVVVDRE